MRAVVKFTKGVLKLPLSRSPRGQGRARLLGLGHFVCFPLLYFLWTRIDQISADGLFGVWFRAVMALDAASLLLDVADVIRHEAPSRPRRQDLLVFVRVCLG